MGMNGDQALTRQGFDPLRGHQIEGLGTRRLAALGYDGDAVEFAVPLIAEEAAGDLEIEVQLVRLGRVNAQLAGQRHDMQARISVEFVQSEGEMSDVRG